MRPFVSVHLGLDRAPLAASHASEHRSLASLLLAFVLAATLNTLKSLARLFLPPTQPRCVALPRSISSQKTAR